MILRGLYYMFFIEIVECQFENEKVRNGVKSHTTNTSSLFRLLT